MDSHKADLVIQYALAVAGEADDYRQRELGPIHLIKYVYLADLASAEAGAGSFTGASWRFHKFGPWAPEVLDRVAPAVQAIGAQGRTFQSAYKEDVVRWRTKQRDLAEQLERKLPWHVARAVRSAVRDFANDTTALLHEVYKTAPMLAAAPGETLQLATEEAQAPAHEPGPDAVPLPVLSKTKVKRLQALVKQRLEQKRHDRAAIEPSPQPRYDEVFAHGQQWLDELAGEPVKSQRGRVRFSDAVWKSPGRRDPEIP